MTHIWVWVCVADLADGLSSWTDCRSMYVPGCFAHIGYGKRTLDSLMILQAAPENGYHAAPLAVELVLNTLTAFITLVVEPKPNLYALFSLFFETEQPTTVTALLIMLLTAVDC